MLHSGNLGINKSRRTYVKRFDENGFLLNPITVNNPHISGKSRRAEKRGHTNIDGTRRVRLFNNRLSSADGRYQVIVEDKPRLKIVGSQVRHKRFSVKLIIHGSKLSDK